MASSWSLHWTAAAPGHSEASAVFERGNRVLLPPEALEPLLRAADSAGARGPLVLTLVARATLARCYCGVRDFTSAPGTVTLPCAVRESLGLIDAPGDASDVVTVRAAPQLRHATHLRLQQLTPVPPDVHISLEALLTAHIPLHFTALERGQVLRLRPSAHGSEGLGGADDADSADAEVALVVVDIKPDGEAVLVQDTNVAVQIDAFDVAAAVAGGFGDASAFAAALLPFDEEVAAVAPASGGPIFLAVALPVTADLASHDLLLSVSCSGGGGATPDVFASFALRKPRLSAHGWWLPAASGGTAMQALSSDAASFPDDGLSFAPPDLAPGGAAAPALYLAARAAAPGASDLPFRLRLSLAPKAPPRIQSVSSAGSSENGAAGLQQCGNCYAHVPTASFALHSASCARNNVRCDVAGCGAVLRRGKEAEAHGHCPRCPRLVAPALLAAHDAAWHAPFACEDGCGARLALAELHAHSQHACPRRILQCRFCRLLVRAGPAAAGAADRERGLSGHEADICGVRTAPCFLCAPRSAVRLKDVEAHEAAFHGGRRSALYVPPSAMLAGEGAGAGAGPREERLGGAFADASPAALNGDGAQPHWHSASAAPSVPPTRACANEPCGSRIPSAQISDTSLAPRERRTLCERCLALLVSSALDTDSEGAGMEDEALDLGARIQRALLPRYEAQVARGCGRVGCRNVHFCRTARGTSFGEEGSGAALAQLVSEALDGRFHVCVTENARFVPAPARTLAVPSAAAEAATSAAAAAAAAATFGPSATSTGLGAIAAAALPEVAVRVALSTRAGPKKKAATTAGTYFS